MAQEFINLMSNMSIVSICTILIGMMLVVIEFYQPARGLVGGVGAALIVTGIVFRMLMRGTVGMLFIMVLFIAGVLMFFHTLMLRIQKKDWLTHSLALLIQKGEKVKPYEFLVGMTGISTSMINPIGHMTINDVNFLVTSATTIEINKRVKVVEASGDKIIVELSEDFKN